MDFDDVLADLNTCGKYQTRIFLLISIPCMFTGFGAPATNFILGDHEHRCKIPFYENDTFATQSEDHIAAINRTIPISSDGKYSSCTIFVNGTEQKCSEWVYDYSIFLRTVTSDFNLVCDSVSLRSHLKIVYLVGFLAASIFSQIGDVFGRRTLMLFLCTLRIAVVFSIPFSLNLAMFGFLRFLEGLTSLAFYQLSFVTAIELVGPRERLFTANLSKVFYCAGMFLMILVAFYERDWFYLQIWLAIPCVPTLLYWIPGLIPESPRWLASRGRTKEASKILKKMAKVNQIKKEVDVSKIIREDDVGIRVILRELFHSKILMRRLFIVTANWVVAAFIYYGLTMNVGSLGGNIYENFSLLILVELLGYSMIFLLNRTGRKYVLLTSIFGCGAASIGSILLILFAENSLHWLHILLSLVSRFGIAVLFGVLYVYTGELFPTVIRSIVMGTVSVGARIGSIISPYLYDVSDGKLGKMIPLISYAVITITVGVCSIRLPETNNRKLMETVAEVEIKKKLQKEDFEEPSDDMPLTSNHMT
uniref:Organic cation transporter protein-like n=1 Tax=Crassostrea virginica TaxID=6565 RepID=A0A8B8C069_CRAVI|nr:organic cation transporter protein-like [Crassostrea virginica]